MVEIRVGGAYKQSSGYRVEIFSTTEISGETLFVGTTNRPGATFVVYHADGTPLLEESGMGNGAIFRYASAEKPGDTRVHTKKQVDEAVLRKAKRAA